MSATPVAFFVFNRPDVTSRVFEAIRLARPKTLLVVADGPRADRSGEPGKCRAVRSIIETIDWPCELLTNYSETNLGCRLRMSSGLNWVFERVEEALILEDDCLPCDSFFPFCDELVNRYRHDERVIAISGDNFSRGRDFHGQFSYYFSHFPFVWGWATWRRAWAMYDVQMRRWPSARDSGLLASIVATSRAQNYWTYIFNETHAGRIDTWDYQWLFACWMSGGLGLIPSVNLVSNLGMHDDATHTHCADWKGNLPTAGIRFPLRHPHHVLRNQLADLHHQAEVYSPSPLQRLRLKIARTFTQCATGTSELL